MKSQEKIHENKQDTVSNTKKTLGTYAYNSMMNYFLTIFFIFGLMLFLLLLIILSREVLSDANFERHVMQTKSLLQELERVERGRENRFDLFNSNINEYQKNSVFKRIIIDDLALSSSQATNISYITFKTRDYSFDLLDDLLVVSNVELELYDYVLYSGSMYSSSQNTLDIYSKGLIIEIIKNDNGIIEELIILRDISSVEDDVNFENLNHNDFFEIISKEQVRGIISLIY
ncbi:MAG: hypothetical protein LAT82_03190 [Nanoarchaeota archaeon]|nr:hypothetical protein [Nanoarchaeota archaeon]